MLQVTNNFAVKNNYHDAKNSTTPNFKGEVKVAKKFYNDVSEFKGKKNLDNIIDWAKNLFNVIPSTERHSIGVSGFFSVRETEEGCYLPGDYISLTHKIPGSKSEKYNLKLHDNGNSLIRDIKDKIRKSIYNIKGSTSEKKQELIDQYLPE